jgi:predicted  nucleic acid-binding Zn-ribbon protein
MPGGILEKLTEHDKYFEKINTKLEEHDKKFVEHDKYFEKINTKLEEHDKKFVEHDNQFDLLARAVTENTTRLDRLEHKVDNQPTKEDFSRLIDSIDQMFGFVKKHDDELPLLAHGLKMLEDKVAAYAKDIKTIKPLVGLA